VLFSRRIASIIVILHAGNDHGAGTLNFGAARVVAGVPIPLHGQRWTVPLGGGVGKIFHLGKLPVNTQLSAYYNVVKPHFGSNWQIRALVQLMFPK
jgi:hypothetical protein